MNGPEHSEKELLKRMVFESVLSEIERVKVLWEITNCINYDEYQELQYRLEAVRIPFNQLVNPSQRDINSWLRKAISS